MYYALSALKQFLFTCTRGDTLRACPRVLYFRADGALVQLFVPSRSVRWRRSE